MRILTVKQPWAWAIIHGGKDVENRVRNLAGDYRGPVAIHAGLRDADAIDVYEMWLDSPQMDYPHGAIIGVVDLVGVHNSTSNGQTPMCWGARETIGDRGSGFCSSWAMPAAKHLELSNPRPLAEPIPYKGSLGMRTLPDDVERQILAALEAQTGENDE